MKILLLGSDGQVGWKLGASLAPLGQLFAPGRHEADLENLESIRRVVRHCHPALIVNAAAYTAVDQAESEPESAFRCNAEAPALLAAEAKRLDALLVHYSTDYVFDGTKTDPYAEEDQPNPLNVYGQSKLAGDEAIIQTACRHLIFRTSWVFSDRGHNFARTILRLAQEREELTVVADQFGAPTSAELLAEGTALALYHIMHHPEGSRSMGLYNLAAAGETNWRDYAVYLTEKASEMGWDIKAGSEKIKPLATIDFPRPALRPSNSRLSTVKFQNTFGLIPPHWSYHVDRALNIWSDFLPG